MISSPSPTPPVQKAPEPPQPVKKDTPSYRRAGETPAAKTAKGILRPVFRTLYYIMQWIRGHRLLSLLLILLLFASIILTNFAATGQWPFGVASDPFNFHVRGTDGGGMVVKNWLYALRSGDIGTLHLLDSDMSQPPDDSTLNQYIGSLSQTNSRTWKSINVIRAYSQPDQTVDSFVSIEYSADGPGGKTNAVAVWHFITVSQGAREYLLAADPVSVRRMLG